MEYRPSTTLSLPLPYPAYAPYPAPPPAPPISPWAVVSLVFGIVGGVLVSVIAGIVALSKTKEGRQGGRGLAIAGLAFSGVWLVALGALATLLVVRHRDMPDVAAAPTGPAVGDCLAEIPEDGPIADIDIVACTQPHRGEVFATVPVPGLNSRAR